jgi:hypothetical protein
MFHLHAKLETEGREEERKGGREEGKKGKEGKGRREGRRKNLREERRAKLLKPIVWVQFKNCAPSVKA